MSSHLTMAPDDAVRAAVARLAEAGVSSAEVEARLLASYAERSGRSLTELIDRRVTREPLQHIVGSAPFRYLELTVGPGVFIPRPESELVAQAVIDELRERRDPVVVDLCAGSGAIGLAVASEVATAHVHLVERSAEAIPWLSRNVAALGDGRVTVHHGDLGDAPTGLDGEVDVVVSNPPYLPVSDREHVEPEVRDHDPSEALWAGADGLEVIHRVVARASQLLRAGGLVVLEHSDHHGRIVPDLLRRNGFVDVSDHQDLARLPRYATGRLPC